jgi:hypothetical protein
MGAMPLVRLKCSASADRDGRRRGHAPRRSMGDVAVQQGECAGGPGDRVVRPASRLVGRRLLDIAAHDLDEEQLRKLGQHRRRSRSAAGHLGCGMVEGRAIHSAGPV